jgi:hypothetical protein
MTYSTMFGGRAGGAPPGAAAEIRTVAVRQRSTEIRIIKLP